VIPEDKANYKTAQDNITKIKETKYLEALNESKSLFEAGEIGKAIEKIQIALFFKDDPEAISLRNQYIKAQRSSAK